MKFLLYSIFLLILSACDKQAEICTEQQANLASKIYRYKVATEWTWPELYDSYKKFGKCADPKNPIWNAELANIYGEAIEFLLAEKWNDIDQFLEIGKKDKEFTSFILFRLDDGMLWDHAVLIFENASNHCPVGHDLVCQSLKSTIEESKITGE